LVREQAWPALPLAAWKNTLGRCTWDPDRRQGAVGAHSLHESLWEVPLYDNARGLTTSPIPCPHGLFEIEFDFIEHVLRSRKNSGETEVLDSHHGSVADFYREVMQALKSLDIETKIWPMPVEIPNPIRSSKDTVHAVLRSEYSNRFWRILCQHEPY